MKTWTEAMPRTANIADYEEFNLAYDPLKSSYNGGISRTEIPADSITAAMIKDEALLQVKVSDDGEFPTIGGVFRDTATGGVTNFQGSSYNKYTGGWVAILEKSYTGLKTGFMHVEFKSHIFTQSYYAGEQTGATTGDGNPKYIRLRLLWNGSPVAETGYYTQPVQTVRVFADIPVPGGDGTLTVHAISPPPGNVEANSASDNLPLWYFWGMQVITIGRWR